MEVPLPAVRSASGYSQEVVAHFRDRWGHVLDSDCVLCSSMSLENEMLTPEVLQAVGAVPLGLALSPEWANVPLLRPFLAQSKSAPPDFIRWLQPVDPEILAMLTAWGLRDMAWYFPDYGVILAESTGHNRLSIDPETIDLCLHTSISRLTELVSDMRRAADDIRGRKRIVVGLGRSEHLEGVVQSLDEVILPKQILDSLVSALDMFLQGPSGFHRLGLPWRRGALLYGPPGCGKTLLTRALASRALDARANVAYRIVGANDADPADDWAYCVKHAPCLLILEDIDGLFRSGVSRSEFLNLMDGLKSGEGVFLLATTNFPEEVDPALVGRAGRFDLSLNIPLPDAAARRSYLQRLWGGHPWGSLLNVAVRESENLGMSALNSIHFEVALHHLRGEPMTEQDLVMFIKGMRRVESAKKNARWDESSSSGTGFRAPYPDSEG